MFCQRFRGINKSCDPTGENGCGCEAGLVCQNITDVEDGPTTSTHGSKELSSTATSESFRKPKGKSLSKRLKKFKTRLPKRLKGERPKSAKVKGICVLADEEVTVSPQNE
jgi:hypothetical protein